MICDCRNGRERVKFMNFMEEMEITNLLTVGGCFTWFSGNG